ncbi:hypothetical protein [Pedobacter insulae]|uniref:Lipoprotein n=1 Tax=Pedobacter insulae TaxID=414048 RepID=A0A1I2XHM3_9SPHI|nr:hypothetical protein [Pedobacter insulae]SFH12529.1 hypothetical protein SAMN04489864_105227 [Pedobacter insulae]
MKINKLLILSLFLGLMSCSGNKNQTSEAGDINLDGAIANAESRRKADPNASGGNECLLGYQTKYNELITENDVLAATGFSKEVMETKSNTVMKKPEYHSFKYKFMNGRMSTVGIRKGLPLPDVVEVKSIKPMSLTAFENIYRAISDEEMKVAKDGLNDVAEGNSGNAEADAALKNAEEKNVSKEQVKEIGSSMMDAFKNISKGYRVVEDLGDAARWNIFTNELQVLKNGVQFVVASDVSDDNEKNKSVAIQMAKIILSKCK